MKILNSQLKEDLASGKAVRLDFGCGRSKLAGCYGVDVKELDGVDVVADFDKHLSDLPSNCADYIFSAHTLEHIHNIIGFMEEIHRISRPEGKIEIITPHFSNVLGYSDPTHCRLFGLYSMYYFSPTELQPTTRKVPCYYSTAGFEVEKVVIEFYSETIFDKCVVPFLRRFVNWSIKTQHIYERRLAHFFHAAIIRYHLVAIK